MKAAVINQFNGIDKIEFVNLPEPEPKEGEILIEVSHAGVNPVDWKICDGLLKSRMEYQFPITLGWDVSGKVKTIGKNVHNFKKGDRVFAYCRKEVIHEGAYAEYICLDAKQVSKIPPNLSFLEAASIPLACLTAWQSLFDTAQLKKEQTVLIHAGAGGVGGFAIQLAWYCGAHILTTASTSNHDYVEELGADETVDYTQESFVTRTEQFSPGGVDVVFDTVGGDTLKDSYQLVKKGGFLVTIAGIPDTALGDELGINTTFVFVKPSGEELDKIASLLEQKRLVPPKIQEIPFEDAKAALHKSKEGHVQGKLVLKIGNFP